MKPNEIREGEIRLVIGESAADSRLCVNGGLVEGVYRVDLIGSAYCDSGFAIVYFYEQDEEGRLIADGMGDVEKGCVALQLTGEFVGKGQAIDLASLLQLLGEPEAVNSK